MSIICYYIDVLHPTPHLLTYGKFVARLCIPMVTVLSSTHTIHNILRYWRMSLADADLMSLHEQTFDQEDLVPRTAIITGHLSSVHTKKLFAARPQHHGSHQSVPTESACPVLVCPIVAKREVPRGRSQHQNACLPLWIPAQLTAEGDLCPVSDRAPWIVRTMLEPTRWSEVAPIGSVETLARFYADHPVPSSTWAAVWQYSCDLFYAVTEQSFDQWTIPQHKVDSTCGVILRPRPFNSYHRPSSNSMMLSMVCRPYPRCCVSMPLSSQPPSVRLSMKPCNTRYRFII